MPETQLTYGSLFSGILSAAWTTALSGLGCGAPFRLSPTLIADVSLRDTGRGY